MKAWVIHLAGVVATVLAIVVSLGRLAPPAPLGLEAPPSAFSAARALSHVRAIARAPRPLGSPAHEAAREYILSTLRGVGLSPTVQDTESTVSIAGRFIGARVRNVIAYIPGTTPGGANIVLASHYDSVANSPGAGDAASGVGTLLETARALLAGAPVRNDVVLLFSDGEELGLLGGEAFVHQHPAVQHTAAVLNFEGRGNCGPVPMFDTGPASNRLVEALAVAAPRPVTASWIAALSGLLPNDTDLTAFKAVGIPGLGFALADGVEHYHAFSDTIDALSAASVQHEGSYALTLARELGNQDLGAPGEPPRRDQKGPNLVYFDWLTAVVVRYGAWTARLFAIATLGLFLWLLVRTVRVGRATTDGVRRGGLLIPVLAISIAGGAGALLWGALSQFGPRAVAAGGRPLTWTAMVATTAAFLVFLRRRAATRYGGRTMAVGGSEENFLASASFLGCLLALSALLAPALTPLFMWPLLFALLGAAPWLLGPRPAPPWHIGLRHLGIALASTMLAPALFAVFIAGAIFGPVAVAGVSSLYLGLALSPCAEWTPRTARRAVAVLTVAFACTAAVAVAQMHASERVLHANSLVYGVDADRGEATLFTKDPVPDPWIDQVLAGRHVGPLPHLLATTDAVSFAVAPLIARPEPTLDVLGDVATASGRELTLRLRSDAACWRIWEERGAPVQVRAADGRPVVPIVRFSPTVDAEIVPLAVGDRSRRVFRFTHCGASPEGVVIELQAQTAAPLEVRMVEERLGLPLELEGRLPRRPEGIGRAPESDLTLVARARTL